MVLLNPRNLKNGYYVETGWATNSENIDVPNSKTIWTTVGNNKLTPSNPVNLQWKNDQGIIFEKAISIDDEYLFTVNQSIKNTSEKKYNFYSYGQIIRNTAPDVTNFYILHEGLLGVFDDQLVEQDYDDIEEKKYSVNAEKGWFELLTNTGLPVLFLKKIKILRQTLNSKINLRLILLKQNLLQLEQMKLNQTI